MAISRRLRAYKVNAESIADILAGRSEIVPLPQTVEVVRYNIDWQTNSAIIIVSDDSFDETPEGGLIDVRQLMCQRRGL